VPRAAYESNNSAGSFRLDAARLRCSGFNRCERGVLVGLDNRRHYEEILDWLKNMVGIHCPPVVDGGEACLEGLTICVTYAELLNQMEDNMDVGKFPIMNDPNYEMLQRIGAIPSRQK